MKRLLILPTPLKLIRRFGLLLALVTLLVPGLTGCQATLKGEGEPATQERPLEEAFTRISVAVPARVVLRQGSTPRLAITAQPNVQESLRVMTGRGRLEITSDRRLDLDQPINIELTIPRLEGVELIGDVELASRDIFQADRLSLEISGRGGITGEFITGALELEINGEGKALLLGRADEVTIEINGSGRVEAPRLEARRYRVEINGEGEADIAVSEALRVEINGNGQVRYKGRPGQISQEINGSGQVQAL